MSRDRGSGASDLGADAARRSRASALRLPALSPEVRAFWTSGSRGALEIYRCNDCAHWIHPPQPICPACRSFAVEPKPVSGDGYLASFSINEQPWLPGQDVPFVFAAVELIEQSALFVMTQIVGCDEGDLSIGMPVHVRFEQHDDIWLPLFEPSSDATREHRG